MSSTRLALFIILCGMQCVFSQYYPYPYMNFPQTQHIPQPFQYPSFNPYPYPQLFPQYYQNRNYRIEPYPPTNQNNQNQYNNFPTEIIDLDANVIVPDQQTPIVQQENPVVSRPAPEPRGYNPVVTESKHHSYSSSTNNTKGIHIFESKPISTQIRKTIISNGKDGQHIVNIHLVNGVEVTSESNIDENSIKIENTDARQKEEDDDDDDDEESSEATETPPKDIFSWFNPKS